MANIEKIEVEELRRLKDKEGLILKGCGGELQDWVDGINQLLTVNQCLLDGTTFDNVKTFENEGVTCLLFPFDNVKLDVGKLAIWRIKTHNNFNGTWLSDYIENTLGAFDKNDVAFGESDEASENNKEMEME